MRFFCLFLFIPAFIFSHSHFLILSCPKCGTHLLAAIMANMTELTPRGIAWLANDRDIEFVEEATNQNEFVFTHSLSDVQVQELIEKNYKILFIYRDPRDQLISLLHWLYQFHPFDPYYQLNARNTDEKIRELITGEIYGIPAYDFSFKDQLNTVYNIPTNHVLALRFEDLIGTNGKGNLHQQIENLLAIANFLDIPLTSQQAEEIGNKSWGVPWTFRKGIIGQWKEYFTPEHIQLYKERYGQLLIELGYEKDFDW